MFTTKERGVATSVSSYSFAGIIEVPAEVPLRLFIHLGMQESYKIMVGSRVSVAVSQQDYQGFHIAVPAPVSFTIRYFLRPYFY